MTDNEAPARCFSIALRFHKILSTVEQELQNALAKARLESDHCTTIGDGAEEAVRNTLRSYLPSGYSVGKGIVYDAFGDGSRQTDVVITNPDHPLSFPDGKSGTYVVDGVAAAGEVKSCLDVTALSDSIKQEGHGLQATADDGQRIGPRDDDQGTGVHAADRHGAAVLRCRVRQQGRHRHDR